MHGRIVWVAAFAALLSCSAVRADDVPPDYRGDSYSTLTMWTQLDGTPQLDWSFVGGNDYQLYNAVPTLDIVQTNQGDYWTFFIPNFVDDLPLKELRWQFEWTGASQKVPSLVGFEAKNGVDPANYVQFDPVVTDLGTGNYHVYGDMMITPNPDWEVLTFLVENGVTLHSATFDTISEVPTPGSLAALVGMGLMGLIAIRRRWKQAIVPSV